MAFNEDVANLFPGYREAQGEIARTNLLNAQVAETQARTESEKQQTVQRQRQMEFQQKLQGLLQQGQTGRPMETPEDYASELERIGQAEIDAGFVNDGQKRFESAALVRSRQATGERAAIAGLKDRITIQEKANTRLAQALEGVDSPESFNKAIDMVDDELKNARMPASGLKGTGYSPETVKLLRNSAMTVAQQKHGQIEELRQRDTALLNKTRAERMRAEIGHWRNIDKDRASQAERKSGKEKATSFGAPNTNERKAAQSALVKAYPGLTAGEDKDAPHPELAAAVSTIASEAKAKIAQNPGLTYEKAVSQSIFEHREDFKANGKKMTFTGGGNEPGTALPLPGTGKIEDVKAGDLVKNKYYQVDKTPASPSGIVLWTGSKIVPVDEEGVEEEGKVEEDDEEMEDE